MENTTRTGAASSREAQEGTDVVPVDALAEVVSALESVEVVLARLQAVREGLLAIASRVAVSMEPDGGAQVAGWDSRTAELAQRAVAGEIAAATRMSDRTVQRQKGQASELIASFPLTFDALAAGRISLAHARVIQDVGTVLSDADARAQYEDAAVGCAERQAPSRLRRVAVREAEKAHSEPLADRHERAREERRVWVNPLPDGMAELGAVLPAVVAYGIHDRLTRMARAYADAAVPAGAGNRCGDDGRTGTGAVPGTGNCVSGGPGTHAGASTAAGAGNRCGADGGETGAAGANTDRGPGDEADSHPSAQGRSLDQLRADLLADMMLRGAPSGHDTTEGVLAAIMARIDVTVPAATLMGSRESAGETPAGIGRPTGTRHPTGTVDAAAKEAVEPGTAPGNGPDADTSPSGTANPVPAELDGRHPIDTDTARFLAGMATGWNRVFTDPTNGSVLAVDRYRPNEDLRRLLRARDSRCRFPGCGIKASELDLDHTVDAAFGGATHFGNLAGLCRRHHMLKHHTGWSVRQVGSGVLEWTSPTGRRYSDEPPTPATYPTLPTNTGPNTPGLTSPFKDPGLSSDPNPPPF
ncbi:HNH endonuclease signature motif containing protein [Arthrobacter celericrescens]|uniref:HNH endonuclease signature motif containing protein n=1 Tax=Arthrobacter celericrescens TaxID=2320851 RepID=UPI000EA168BF|nr:HNH endonuclease signature motif containing protein [Arthrobacter celericrescens]